MAFIRPYQAKDHDQVINIFNETADPDLRARGQDILYLASFNWCRPYPMLYPEHCFVADDGTGRAVGYVLGVPSTRDFGGRYVEHYIPYLQSQGLTEPSAGESTDWYENLPGALRRIMYHQHEDLLQKQLPGFVDEYPAHFHIDLLPGWQRQGLGRQLMEAFLSDARKSGAGGAFCAMAASNAEAGKFYARIGFEPYRRTDKNAEDANAIAILQTKRL